MSTTSDRLGAQAKEITSDLKQMGGIIRDAAQEKLGQVRENATEYYEKGRDKVRGVACTFEQCVRERPVKSVLIAAVIGLVSARLWMRR